MKSNSNATQSDIEFENLDAFMNLCGQGENNQGLGLTGWRIIICQSRFTTTSAR